MRDEGIKHVKPAETSLFAAARVQELNLIRSAPVIPLLKQPRTREERCGRNLKNNHGFSANFNSEVVFLNGCAAWGRWAARLAAAVRPRGDALV